MKKTDVFSFLECSHQLTTVSNNTQHLKLLSTTKLSLSEHTSLIIQHTAHWMRETFWETGQVEEEKGSQRCHKQAINCLLISEHNFLHWVKFIPAPISARMSTMSIIVAWDQLSRGLCTCTHTHSYTHPHILVHIVESVTAWRGLPTLLYLLQSSFG